MDKGKSPRLRSVRSFGVTNKPSQKTIGVSPPNHFDECVASKFSHAAQLGQYTIRRSGGKLPSATDLLESDSSDNDSISSPSSTDEPQENMVMSLLKQSGRGKVGYVSLFMLVLFTFSNFALEIVDAQIHRIDSPDLYDTLSAEVLSPPFHYTSDRARSSSLGTAAISSVTEALSPILPCAGGVDLRREEHWDTSKGWFNTATSMVNQVRDAFGLEAMTMQPSSSYWSSMVPRGGAQSSSSGTKVHVAPPKRKPQTHVSTISAATPFVSIDTIAGMTLGDLTAAFQFAVESTRPGFNEKKFLDSVNARMRPIIMGLKNAASKSRGIDVEPALTVAPSSKYDVDYGNFDALQFCGAMRLFAEWRVVRQVPDGYKGFAVGMNLGQKDIVQNVAKIEKSVHDWIEYRRDLLTLQSQWDSADAMENTCPVDAKGGKDCTLRSPTLRQLLEHELDMDVHDKHPLPRLKDKTAAMGLLWVRRQLHYQTELFANILQVPTKFTTANTAVTAAYNAVYGKFHGWAVQKIFTYSFQAAPEVDVIYRYMNPHQLVVSEQKAGQKKALGSSNKFDDDNSSDDDSSSGEKGLNPFQKLGNHIVGAWENAFGDDTIDLSDDEADGAGLGGSDFEEYVTKEMTEDAHKHISLYLEVVQPVLGDLLGLFDEMNMDDPSKV
eukprot:CAMPEP_0119010692 /NCGR_PEP_ID=MMETSP1176-20130426/5177_1 /TAXON_ID=265551 /ORGANISM="Synedropsis recta cf, Strain CCMP1620" /LENGTH=664 /DNA_ID=CAMNT_0006963401 /DNA_START=155 /DNA_END=2149 /DNA_ORIENTATION=-